MNIIDTIKQQRDQLADILKVYDTILNFERDRSAILIAPSPEPDDRISITPAGMDALASAKPARARKPVTKPSAQPSSQLTFTDHVFCAITAIPEPFTMLDIRAWLLKHRPAVADSAGMSTWGTTIYALVNKGYISELGEKVNNQAAYKRGRHLPATATAPATPAARYEEFRSTISTPSPQD